MQVEPQKEHHWLQKLVGEWTSEATMLAGEGQPSDTTRGTESVRALGALWVLLEGASEMPGGGSGTMLMTLGYDPERKRFVGTWVGSMMTHLWVYDGELDAAGCKLTLSSVGPKFSPEGGTASYRDVIELKGDDERTLSSYLQGDDGSWKHFNTATYRRKR